MTALLTLVLLAIGQPPESPLTPLRRAHAHNDDEHKRLLFDALDQGFCSVEADIWVSKDGLLVGHTPLDLKPGRTLQKLDLDPLRERVRANGGEVFKDGPPFHLLVDVKTDAKATYAELALAVQVGWNRRDACGKAGEVEGVRGEGTQEGRLVRFWATPEKPELWRELLAADVDLINTDKLPELRVFLRMEEKQ
ncbi:MAG TPA: hypothetical protein VKE74_10745 [Gemmataceae bacterium]|nr:hypothetical protein [Gemmataceae bacterium]